MIPLINCMRSAPASNFSLASFGDITPPTPMIVKREPYSLFVLAINSVERSVQGLPDKPPEYFSGASSLKSRSS